MRFSEFGNLSERSVDPLALQQRVSRRYAKKTNYGQYWDNPEPGQHIPLNGYKTRTANMIDAKLADLTSSLGLHSRDPAVKAAASEKYKAIKVKETLPITGLIPTQPFTRHDDQELTTQKLNNVAPDKIHIVRYKNKNYILDGHHSIMAAKLRGEKSITANVTDLDKISKK